MGQNTTFDVELAGTGLAVLLQAYQRLLQTVSDLMHLLPIGSPLLTLAVRCLGRELQALLSRFSQQVRVLISWNEDQLMKLPFCQESRVK